MSGTPDSEDGFTGPAPLAAIEAALVALEAQRHLLGDTVAELAMAPLRARLAALQGSLSRQRLTQATVLFADVVGSTDLSRQLDPEAMHIVLDGAMQDLTALVGRHGGRVLQYAGDSLLAVFGSERAQEDDAERAVLAGLDMLAEARQHAGRVQRRYGPVKFGLRVGVHSGPVLLGGGVDGDASIRGNAVHIAARMEQTAPVDGLRISQDVYRQVRGAFEVQAQPPLNVKGAAMPMVTYLVTQALPRTDRASGRGVEGLVSPLVGRAAELAQLVDAYDAVVREGRCRCVVLVGEAGVGKTRLLGEFVRLVGMGDGGNGDNNTHASARIWRARGHPQWMQQPYGLLRDLFFGRVGIQDSDSQAEAQRKLAQGAASVFVECADEHTALLGQLLGLDFGASPHVSGIAAQGQQVRDRGLHAASLWLAHEARAGDTPLLLWLDDLHWADDGSRDALLRLLPSWADLPMLVLCAARNALGDSPSGGIGDMGALVQEQLVLHPLDGPERAKLADVLLQRLGAVPQALRALVAETAGGNPFFMEELTQMLLDDEEAGAGGGLTPTSAAPLRRLPVTVAGVIQARLDALPQSHWQTLQCASVVGPVFWDEVLSEMHPGAADALPALQEQGLAQRRPGSSFDGTREFAFRHHLFHQATYDSVLRRDRGALHAQVARWLGRRSAQRPGEWHAVIAAHLEQAGDTAAAVRQWGLAAENAIRRCAVPTSLAHLDRALALCDADDHRGRFTLLLSRDWALHLQGDAVNGLATIESLTQLALRLGDPESCTVAANRHSRLLAQSGQCQEALAVAQQSIAGAAGASPQSRAQAEFQAAVALVRMGNYAAVRQHCQQALAHLDAAVDPPSNMRPSILAAIGGACLHTHDKAGAAEHYRRALALYRANGDLLAECSTLGMLGDLSRVLGDHARARNALQSVLVLSARLGSPRSQAYAHMNLSLVELNDGDTAAALSHAQDAQRLAQLVGDRWAEAVALNNAAHAWLAQDDLAGAEPAYAASLAQHELLGARNTALEPLAGLAAVALARGQVDRARDFVDGIEQRLAEGASLDGLDEPLRLRWACYRALAAAGDLRADATLCRAHAELQAAADGLSESATRHTFLSQSAAHRGIAAAWAARGAAAEAGGLGP